MTTAAIKERPNFLVEVKTETYYRPLEYSNAPANHPIYYIKYKMRKIKTNH